MDNNASVACPQTKIIFDTLYEIRMALNETFPNEIRLDYPIEELKDQKISSRFLGMTFFDDKKSVNAIRMKIRSDTGEPYHLLRVIPTFIHELAHEFRERIRLEELLDVRKKKVKCIDGHHSDVMHDDKFYDCFSKLLGRSEELGIFSLPPIPNKYSFRNLRHYDKIDLAVCPLNFCGLSPKYCNDNDISNQNGSLSLIVTYLDKKKPVNLSIITLNELLKVSAQKLNLRFKLGRALTLQGMLLDDTSLATLSPGSVIQVAK
eukprot:TRINITY_DN12449_c0_g1_i1.p1 TRINITY_DN12449_c0_g1~~TRINITY_DN12449_c0_g1_i1.p1  ORF type:complete len:300 (-),score=9.11 TRINITY_DN12449_c0_g1_i1:36-821(-)